MKTLFGGLCLVAFAITSVAYLAGRSNLETKDPASSPVAYQAVGPDQTRVKDEVKDEVQKIATKVVIVGQAWCPPCQRMRPRITLLKSMGYDVYYVDFKKWTGPKVSMTPHLFYFNKDDIYLQEVGAKTLLHIKNRMVDP